eukprot:3707661-Pyramimonas_sp.AAC.1
MHSVLVTACSAAPPADTKRVKFPAYLSEFPAYLSELPAYMSELPAYMSEFPAYMSEFPAYMSESIHFSERFPAVSASRPLPSTYTSGL